MLALHPRRPGTRLTIGLRRLHAHRRFPLSSASSAPSARGSAGSTGSQLRARGVLPLPVARAGRRPSRQVGGLRPRSALCPAAPRRRTPLLASCGWRPQLTNQSATNTAVPWQGGCPGFPGNSGNWSSADDRPVCESQTQIANFNFGHTPFPPDVLVHLE